MRLKSLDAADLARAGAWLGDEQNARWLDFGGGTQGLDAAALKIMAQRALHILRVFTGDDGTSIGLVALSNVSPRFGTATLWYVLGEKGYAGRGYTTRAVAEMLTVGFRTQGLRAVNAWAVETNAPSIRILLHNRFRPIGRQRRCHVVDGQACDRLLFDLLASEHGED
jgi:RimJ/RimL family protein N-acetyltransferase